MAFLAGGHCNRPVVEALERLESILEPVPLKHIEEEWLRIILPSLEMVCHGCILTKQEFQESQKEITVWQGGNIIGYDISEIASLLLTSRFLCRHPHALCTGQDFVVVIDYLCLSKPLPTLSPSQPRAHQDIARRDYGGTVRNGYACSIVDVSRSRLGDIMLMQQNHESHDLVKNNTLESPMDNGRMRLELRSQGHEANNIWPTILDLWRWSALWPGGGLGLCSIDCGQALLLEREDMGYRGWSVHCPTEEAVLPCLFIQVPGEEGHSLVVSVVKDTSSPVNGGKVIHSGP